MRANQIGFLLCRLVAVGTVLWSLPGAIGGMAQFKVAIDGMYKDSAWTHLVLVIVYLGMLSLACVLWFTARRASRWLNADGEATERLSIEPAQFAAIGLALLGVLAIFDCARGLVPVLVHLFSPKAGDLPLWRMLFGGGGNDAVLMGLLGVLLLAFAPRLGIWLEDAPTAAKEGGIEPL